MTKKTAGRIIVILAIPQWLGCLYLTCGAVYKDSPTIALMAEIAITFTVFIDWVVWKASRHD